MKKLSIASNLLALSFLGTGMFLSWEVITNNDIMTFPAVRAMSFPAEGAMTFTAERAMTFPTERSWTFSPSSTESVWQNISQALTMDHKVDSAEVQKQIKLLLANRAEFNRILSQAAPYIYFIYTQTQAKGLPAELALIPFIESEFNANDRSKAGATGLWQLMPKTAQELGVQVKPGYDGRRDVIASTKAALAYFKDLGRMFKGNWDLAIGAYNCGQGRIMAAMKKAGSDSFWNLNVPKETQAYVPKLLAVAAIVKDPAKYNIELPHVDNQPYFTEVKTTKPVDVHQISQSAGIDVKTLHKLNPDYNNGVVPKNGSYSFLVPVEHAEKIQAKIS